VYLFTYNLLIFQRKNGKTQINLQILVAPAPYRY